MIIVGKQGRTDKLREQMIPVELPQIGADMRIIHDYGLVRIVSTGLDPRATGSDINVEVRDSDANPWEFYCGFNSFSDDYAHTNAREAAGRAIKGIAARKAAM